ncbi:MAG: hypothetical protein U1F33_01395 [Alphaproteobacteria bacterium]
MQPTKETAALASTNSLGRKLRYASWNLNGRTKLTGQQTLLEEAAPDIFACQEVTSTLFEKLMATRFFDWGACSLELRPPRIGEGRGRQLGCALFGKLPLKVLEFSILDSVPFPERTIVALIEAPWGRFRSCSFHVPPGASWGKLKPQTAVEIARWLSAQVEPTIFGIDANAPKTDHPDHMQNEWWWADEPKLLGPAPLHHLHDTLRVYLRANPHVAAEMVTRYPNGPLAVPHERKRGSVRTKCRYDFIYATDNFGVDKVEYCYERACQAGSDHALVLSDLVFHAKEDRGRGQTIA